jgi:hypothetical protein
MSRRSLGSVDHKEELEECICRGRSGLHDEDSRSAYALVVGWLEFAVAEDEDIRTSDLDVECLGYLQCKIL